MWAVFCQSARYQYNAGSMLAMVCDAGLTLGQRLVTSQQTQNICITLMQRRRNVLDVDPTLYKMLYRCFVFAGLSQAITPRT